MFANLAPARRRLVFGLLATVCVTLVALGVVLVVPRVMGGSAEQADQNQPGPVLLVPGYGGSTGSLRSLAAKLTAAGRDATVIELPGNGTGDLSASADVLGDEARAALARTGATSVDVVGYSAGGIVTRLWVADGGLDLTRRVVLLGSPNHGTSLADLAGNLPIDACPAACRQLATDSDVLRRLNAGDETPDGPTWVSIWTTQDETVTPPETARLDGAVNVPIQSVCADARVGHSALPSTPLVQAIVLAELGAGPAVPLTDADCTRLRRD